MSEHMPQSQCKCQVRNECYSKPPLSLRQIISTYAEWDQKSKDYLVLYRTGLAENLKLPIREKNHVQLSLLGNWLLEFNN